MSVLPVPFAPARCRDGSMKIEYALLVALIAFFGLVATNAVGNGLNALMHNTATHLARTPPTQAPPVPR